MLSGFKKLLRPPVFDDLEMAAQARSIHRILLGTMVLTFLFLLYAIVSPPPVQLIIAIIALVFEFGLLVLVRARHIRLVSGILTSLLWAAIVLEVSLYGGIRDTGYGAFAAIILIAGLTMGTRAGFLYAVITLVTSAGLAFAENQGYLPKYTEIPITSVLLSHSIELIAVALLFDLAIRSITTITRKVVEKENAEKETSVLLEASQADLSQRTAALEKRNFTLQTVAAISRLTNEVRSEDELLEHSAKLLIEQNKLEYAGFYILDQMEESAILQISHRQSGKLPSQAGIKLNVIRNESLNPLMGVNALHYEIEKVNYYIEIPNLLPEMQTSLTFPLISNERLYGLMNIQDESPASSNIENETLQTLADQIAVSMANMRLLNQLQSRIKEIDVLVRGTVQSTWEQLGSGGTIGYSYDRMRVLASDESFPPEVANQLLAGKTVSFISTDANPHARLATPIILRENIIGVIGYDNDSLNHEWQEDEKALLETVASRVSLALENTRLVAEAQQRAERERLIGQVTTKMRETLDIETILRTAVKEMRQSLALSGAEVRLQAIEQSTPLEVSHE
jgi:GAF domain-containing protein